MKLAFYKQAVTTPYISFSIRLLQGEVYGFNLQDETLVAIHTPMSCPFDMAMKTNIESTNMGLLYTCDLFTNFWICGPSKDHSFTAKFQPSVMM